MAERDPTVIERMAAARWESMEGLIKPFQSPWAELEEARQKAECSTMLAALQVLARAAESKPPTLSTRNWLCNLIREAKRAGGKGE